MKIQKRKRKKNHVICRIMPAFRAACIVCVAAAVICGGEDVVFGTEPMLGDEFIARYRYENIDEEGVLFPWQTWYSLVRIEMQVGLWYKEGYIPEKENPYVEISWGQEMKKKVYLDKDLYCRKGVYDPKQGEPELEPVSIVFFVSKNTLSEEGVFGVKFVSSMLPIVLPHEIPYEIPFRKENPPDVMLLKYKKQEDGLLIYTKINPNEIKNEWGDEADGNDKSIWGLKPWQEDDLHNWFCFDRYYEIF